jgi:hypothetical protein
VIIYDTHFNGNEWFILIGLCIGYTVMFVLPRRFSRKQAILFGLYGIFGGLFCDHTLSVDPFNLYDVNDTSNFTFMDFLSYLMYGPFGYIFAYVYDKFNIKPSWIPVYILAWSLIAICVEAFAVHAGVFHYSKHYKLAYSFPIYIFFQSGEIALYYGIKNAAKKKSGAT